MTIGRIPSVEGGIQPTIVDAKGDLIAGVAADSVNRLAVGTNGTVLTADSSTSTGLIWTGVNQMANPVINGGFDIWQRGTSISAAASSGPYTTDRWTVVTAPNQATTISRQTTSDTTNLPNIQYCARVQRNSGQTGTGNHVFCSSLESTNSIPLAGKTVTLSFYARAGANFSASGSVLGVYLMSGTGTDQNRANGPFTGEAYVINNQSAVLTTTWQRFAFTGTFATTTTQVSPYFYYQPTGTAGANDYYEITGVQLDVGTYTASTAPTFRRSGGTIQGELAACQRYYWRATAGSIYQAFASGHAVSTTGAAIFVANPVIMRTTPTSLDYSSLGVTNSAGSVLSLSSAAINYAGTQGSWISIGVSSGLTAGNGTLLTAANSTSAYIGLNAEL